LNIHTNPGHVTNLTFGTPSSSHESIIIVDLVYTDKHNVCTNEVPVAIKITTEKCCQLPDPWSSAIITAILLPCTTRLCNMHIPIRNMNFACIHTIVSK